MQTILLCVILSMLVSIVFGQWYMWQVSKLLTMQLKEVEKITTGVIDEVKRKLGIHQEDCKMFVVYMQDYDFVDLVGLYRTKQGAESYVASMIDDTQIEDSEYKIQFLEVEGQEDVWIKHEKK